MHRRRWLWLAAVLVAALFALAACGGDDDEGEAAGDTAAETSGGETSGGADCDSTDSVTLQLKWVTQAQFAGYYAAQEEGYYEDECLNVTLRPGGPDIVPEQVVAG